MQAPHSKMRFGSVALLLLLALGCSSKVERPPLTGSDFVRLERTPCFGACPVYVVTVYGDGRSEFTGKMYVKLSGTVTSSVGMDTVRALFDEATRLQFFELADKYESKRVNDTIVETPTDLPGRRFTVSRAGKTKTVYDYYAGPRELLDFASDIDAAAGVSKWLNK